MRDEEVRTEWEELRKQLDRAAIARKSSQEAVLELSERYRRLSSEERKAVDPLLAEWVTSESEGKRFDAMVLVADHEIRSAIPALRELAARLDNSTAPGAPYELAKVNRIVELLTRDDR